jgi:hypothetical protein
MASSSEAFEKLSQWKIDKTWLNVTVIERGKPEDKLLVRIAAIDEEASLIGTAGKKMHSFSKFDVEDAEFSIESGRMVVSRDDLEWLIFEETES